MVAAGSGTLGTRRVLLHERFYLGRHRTIHPIGSRGDLRRELGRQLWGRLLERRVTAGGDEQSYEVKDVVP